MWLESISSPTTKPAQRALIEKKNAYQLIDWNSIFLNKTNYRIYKKRWQIQIVKFKWLVLLNEFIKFAEREK